MWGLTGGEVIFLRKNQGFCILNDFLFCTDTKMLSQGAFNTGFFC